MKPGGSNDSLILGIYDDKGPAAVHCFFEEAFEYIFFIAIALWMLFPDEGVGRDGKKIIPVFSRERAKLDEFAFQMWLKIEGQSQKSEVAPDHAFASEVRRTANEIGNPIKNMWTKSPVTNTTSGKDTLRG